MGNTNSNGYRMLEFQEKDVGGKDVGGGDKNNGVGMSIFTTTIVVFIVIAVLVFSQKKVKKFT